MDHVSILAVRVRDSATLADLLGAGFDMFEAIRIVSRACEDRAPELFATFMMAAGAAVEGRNALIEAPSLPVRGNGPSVATLVTADGSIERVADELADLAGLLASRIRDAAAVVAGAGDRAACQHAAFAAAKIHGLLAQHHNERLAR